MLFSWIKMLKFDCKKLYYDNALMKKGIFCGITCPTPVQLHMLVAYRQLLNKRKGPTLWPSRYRSGIRYFWLCLDLNLRQSMLGGKCFDVFDPSVILIPFFLILFLLTITCLSWIEVCFIQYFNWLFSNFRADGSIGKRVTPYVVDLDSANGTTVNNKKIEPR